MIRELIVKYDTEDETLCINAEEMEVLVRCKDCKRFMPHDDGEGYCAFFKAYKIGQFNYCGYGERKE